MAAGASCDARRPPTPVVPALEHSPFQPAGTPQDLIDDGLYAMIAIALHAAPHREVSTALVAQACGAVPRKMVKGGLNRSSSMNRSASMGGERASRSFERASTLGGRGEAMRLGKNRAKNRARQLEEIKRFDREAGRQAEGGAVFGGAALAKSAFDAQGARRLSTH